MMNGSFPWCIWGGMKKGPRLVLRTPAGATDITQSPARRGTAGRASAVPPRFHLGRIPGGGGGEVAGEPDMTRVQVLGQGERDEQAGPGGPDGQQRGAVAVGVEGHPGAAIDRHGHRGDPAGGHQAASLLAIGRAALRPVARRENAIRAVHLPRPWQRPESTYGVTVRFSNSTSSNGVRVGGTGWRSPRTLTTT